VPSAAIHSLQPAPQAFGSPFATKNTMGGFGGRSTGAGRQCTGDAGGQQDDAQKVKTTDDDHAAVQLVVAPTLQGCKFRCHSLTTPSVPGPIRGRMNDAYLHS
jgi:hypothetical protein